MTVSSPVSGPSWDASKGKWKWTMTISQSGGTGTIRYQCVLGPGGMSAGGEKDSFNWSDNPIVNIWLPVGGSGSFVAYVYSDRGGGDMTFGFGPEVILSSPCMVEIVTVGEPTWNSVTGKWDYLVTLSAQGGTPPYFHSTPNPQTISLSPKESFNLGTSASDSTTPTACTDSNSTLIGPAPDTPPVAGPCFESGTPESNSGKSCGEGPICIATSGNNNVAGGAGSPQGHGGYAGVGRKGRNDNSRKPIQGITNR